MRKIVAATFISLDGVMQGPGAPEEDPTGGFEHGGWTVPYWDNAVGAALDQVFDAPFDLLLGRRTYDIFAAHWPHVPRDPATPGHDARQAAVADRFDAAAKHVATRVPSTLAWANSHGLGPDIAGAVRGLKHGDGPALLVQGSSTLLQTLIAEDLVDEYRLLTYPVVLGSGKRLFGDGARPAAFDVAESRVTPRGVVITRYARVGAVKTGSFAFEEPTAAEVARRAAKVAC